MKPTSLSPEFYENLYNNVLRDYDFDPDCDDPEESQCSTYIEVEDFEGFFISLKATYELNVVDDSFDHAFGTEYGYHMEVGNLIEIDEVTMYDEDEDVTDLFDYDKFFEQFKKYEVKFFNGKVVKSGDTVQAGGRYHNCWDEMTFLYYDALDKRYVCVPVGNEDNCINRRRYSKMRPCA